MKAFSEQWEMNKLEFDCVHSGFLASVEQIDVTKDFIGKFINKRGLVLVDPVMGDEGSITTRQKRFPLPGFRRSYIARLCSDFFCRITSYNVCYTKLLRKPSI